MNINHKTPFLSMVQMRALDAEAARVHGGFVYMQRAGKALFQKVCELLDCKTFQSHYCLNAPRRRFADTMWSTRSVLILAGRGNNGGDGIVLAHLLRTHGRLVQLVLLRSAQDFQGEAAQAWDEYSAAGGLADVLTSIDDLQKYSHETVSIVVDAITGTGLREGLRDLACEAATWLNASRLPVLSVDVPSGVNLGLAGVHVQADWTLVLGFPRLDCAFAPTGEAYGQWDVADLAYPEELVRSFQEEQPVYVVDRQSIASMLPARSHWKDKRGQGLLCVVAGSQGMTGAATLCAMAGMRSGAGMVHLAAPNSEIPVLASKLTEVVLHPQVSAQGALTQYALPEILQVMDHCAATCVGPGLSFHDDVPRLVRRIVAQAKCPLVVDADGLNAFRESPELLRSLAFTPVLTPHDGEWLRLFQEPAGNGLDRIKAVRKHAHDLQAVILLKGAPTLIGAPNGDVYVLAAANSGLAKAGSGDVLAGIIASLRAQGAGALEAALVGAWVHAATGLQGANHFGARSVLPSDLLTLLPEIFNALETED